jgi:alpha-beta hydrolase superfamily lysophospholipase
VDGLLLFCPGFKAKVKPSLTQRLLIVAFRLFRPRKLFPIPLNDPDLFTANPQRHAFIRDDPLRLHHATARLLLESARLDGYLRFVPKYVHVPVLLLLAERDRIIHNRKTRTFVERFATPDKEVIEYPEAHHTLEFEPDPERFIGDVLAWLEKHADDKVTR